MAGTPFARALILFSAALCAQTANAAERIYCAASDAVADMSLEVGFSPKDPERLQHFRGIAGIKDKVANTGPMRFELNSEMIRQYWIDGADLRFSLRTPVSSRRPAFDLSVVVLTQRKSMASLRFEGSYRMKVVHHAQPGQAGGETVVEQTAPIFCSIKR